MKYLPLENIVWNTSFSPHETSQMSVHVSYLDGKNEILLWFMNNLPWQNVS